MADYDYLIGSVHYIAPALTSTIQNGLDAGQVSRSKTSGKHIGKYTQNVSGVDSSILWPIQIYPKNSVISRVEV